MKIYRYGAGMLWLCCLLSFPAAAQVLLERDGQALMQADVDNMLAAGEQLAGAAFSADERTQLQAWALQLSNRKLICSSQAACLCPVSGILAAAQVI
ncbi:MAG: hypothetical protein R3E89_19435 [Thiolinea sp.]